MYSEYPSENGMYDTDSMTSYSSHSSSTPVDGVIFSDSVQEWFQLDQPFQQEIVNQSEVNIYSNTVQETATYLQQDSTKNSDNSNYTYIFDSFTTFQNDQNLDNCGKTKPSKRRRVQTPYQRKAANVRERRRMCNMNEAFDELRERLPALDHEKKLSRIDTLKLAMTYISFMKDLSKGNNPSEVDLFKRHDKVKDAFLQSVGEISQ